MPSFEVFSTACLIGGPSCWYAQLTSLFQLHGIGMDRLPPFQYSLDALSLHLTKTKITQIIKQNLLQLDTRRKEMQALHEMDPRMGFLRRAFSSQSHRE